MKRTALQHNAPANDAISYAVYRFPPDVICYAVWLYYRFPLSLRIVEELLAARGIDLTYETVRRWSVKFGLGIARRIRSTARARGDKRHLDEVGVTIKGNKHWLWRAVRRLMRTLLKKHGRSPRVLITDRGKQGPGAERGTPAAQRTEQPGRELAPANAGAREGDSPLQISAPPAAIASVHDRWQTCSCTAATTRRRKTSGRCARRPLMRGKP
jgi:hypothetical protein